MKSDIVQLSVALMVLIAAAAAETLLPKFSGVGFPLLLAAATVFGGRWTFLRAELFGVAAGAFEDAICSLPMAMSAVYFFAAAAAMRKFSLSPWSIIPFYVVYQLWIIIWVPLSLGGFCNRLLLAVPTAAAAMLLTLPVLHYLSRKAALDED